MRCPVTTSGGLRLAALLLAELGGLFACAKKKPPRPPTQELQWQGLRLGMERARAEQQLKAAGMQVTCLPSQNVTFLDGQTLHTRWVRSDGAARLTQCDARLKKGAKLGPERVFSSKLYFLDGKLYRLHAKIASNDQVFHQVLRARFGGLSQQSISRLAYASKKPSRIRVWALARQGVQMLWLRAGPQQQLVLFTGDPQQVKVLRSLSVASKDG
jgi:hypothetical protein